MRLSKLELFCLLGTAALISWAVAEMVPAEQEQTGRAVIAEVVPGSAAPDGAFTAQPGIVLGQIREAQPQADNVPPTTYPTTAAEQQARDALAKPGDWVTPPAYSKSE